MDGILGLDFFLKHNAIIDYEKFLFTFWNEKCKITCPLQSKYKSVTNIPPRCETIKYFWVDDPDECVVLPNEIAEGVFTAAIIVKPKSHMIPVRILNTNEKEVKLRNFKPITSKLSNFELHSFNNNQNSLERVNKLLDLINVSHLNNEEKNSIQKICAKFADVFLLDGDPLTVTNVMKETITLKDNVKPVYKKPYRLPHSQKQEINELVNKMLKNGVIEETKSSWSSPLLIVPKKGNIKGDRARIVFDYRSLNERIEDDRFPLPNITEILDSLGGAIYFSHLDLSQAYHQVELEPSCRKYTAFTTPSGFQFQMTRLPQGLKISANCFSRVMTIAMSGLNYNSCFVYLDDLIVFGNSLQNHNQNLVKVLNRLRKVNLKLNPSKCTFLKKDILYLGHIISSEGISPDINKVKAVQNYPTPKNADECKRFVAMANYYRKFIENFAQIAYPLNRLSRKSVEFNWTNDCQISFEKLKRALVKPPVLQYPDFSPNNQFILATDASAYAIGAVLSNSDGRPVAYASRALNKAEQLYPIIQKEMLAIVFAVKHFRPYLFGRKFEIQTDHRPLVYLFGMNDPSSRLTKFRLVLEEYDFTISYVKGKENAPADALSRIHIDSNDLKNMSNNVYVMTRSIAKQRQLQNSESLESFSKENNERTGHPGIVELLKRPKDSVELRELSNNCLRTKMNNNNIVKKGQLIYDKSSQIIFVKRSYRSTIALDALLRYLRDICNEYGIPQICVYKCQENEDLINFLSREPRMLRDLSIKICIINQRKRIECAQTRRLILNDFHILPTGGHAGINRMYANIKKLYFWNNLKDDIYTFVRKCEDCQRYKHTIPNKEPLSITTTASCAFEKVFLDLVGPLSQDDDDNRYILTIQCELTKFVECYPIKNKEAETVAKSFVNNFILRFGIPKQIVTDQGTEFLADIFKKSAKLLGIKQLSSTAYHHETLGSLENTHKHLGSYLRTQVANFTYTWSTWVPFWCFCFNNTVHTSTKYTPYELVFGKNCNLPSNILTSIDPVYNFENYPTELKFRLQSAWNDAKNNLIESKVKRKDKLDKNCTNITYKFNDKVLLKSEVNNKLEAIYKGPFKVISEAPPNVTLKIKNKLVEVHKNRVKRYIE